MPLIGPLVTLGVLAVAFAYGGRAERETGLLLLAGLAVSVGLTAVVGLHRQLPVALADVVLTEGLLLLCVRHRRS